MKQLKLKRIKCWLFGHRINRFMIEHSKKKNCLRCGEEIYDWGSYTVDDFHRDMDEIKNTQP